MIVCLPEDLPTSALADGHNLEHHLGVYATAAPILWTTSALRRRHHRHLIGLRPGKSGPRWCAGGPVGLLDLDGMRRAAALATTITHHAFATAVRGTRGAVGWPVYLARHLDQPGRYPLERARRDFNNQPRVLAMRAYNAAWPVAGQLDPAELEALQAGQNAYGHLRATAAICGDALLTANGMVLRPATAHLADRITYLTAAHQHLTRLHRGARLLALTLTPPAGGEPATP